MPIQIKELIIRATVNSEVEPQTSPGRSAETDPSKKEKIQEQTVQRCVDEVLEILRIQNER